MCPPGRVHPLAILCRPPTNLGRQSVKGPLTAGLAHYGCGSLIRLLPVDS